MFYIFIISIYVVVKTMQINYVREDEILGRYVY